MENLAQRLKRLRKAADLTQPELSKESGAPSSTIAEIETGTTLKPTFETLQKLAKYFKVTEDWLLTGRGVKHSVSSMKDEESELLLLFRDLSDPGKNYLLSRVRDLHADEHRSRPNHTSQPSAGDGDGKSSKPQH